MRHLLVAAGAALIFGCGYAVAGLDVPPSAPDLSGYVSKSEMPAAATAVPPATDIGGTTGSSNAYARADHTHATSVQRARLQVPTAGTTFEWTFAKPYDAGVVPVVTCTAQAGANPTLPFVVNTVDAPTATKATIVVFRSQTQTLGGTLLSIAGVTINLFAAAPSGTWVNCQAARATQ